VLSWGQAPKPPWFRFAEGFGLNYLLRSRTNAFCFFFWKKKTSISSIGHLMVVEQYFSWGLAPKPPESASPRVGLPMVFCEAEQTLFASFSGKRRHPLVQLVI
jgi:hypothetical protein